MSSVPTGDPTADWFRRNRSKLAWAAWLLFGLLPLLGTVLVDPNGRDIASTAARAGFLGVLSWSWGSKQDRSGLPYYRALMLAWAGLLVVYLGFAVAALVREGSVRPLSLIGIGLIVLLLLAAYFPYRRIKSGRPWPPEPRRPASGGEET